MVKLQMEGIAAHLQLLLLKINLVGKGFNQRSSLCSLSVAEHLIAQHSAIKMLHSRVKIILEYVKAVEAGERMSGHFNEAFNEKNVNITCGKQLLNEMLLRGLVV